MTKTVSFILIVFLFSKFCFSQNIDQGLVEYCGVDTISGVFSMVSQCKKPGDMSGSCWRSFYYMSKTQVSITERWKSNKISVSDSDIVIIDNGGLNVVLGYFARTDTSFYNYYFGSREKMIVAFRRIDTRLFKKVCQS